MTVKEIQIQNSPHREHRQSRRECEKGGKIRKENITDSSKQNTASKSLLILTSHQRVFPHHPSSFAPRNRRETTQIRHCVRAEIQSCILCEIIILLSLGKSSNTVYFFLSSSRVAAKKKKREKLLLFIYFFECVFRTTLKSERNRENPRGKWVNSSWQLGETSVDVSHNQSQFCARVEEDQRVNNTHQSSLAEVNLRLKQSPDQSVITEHIWACK